MPLPRLHPPHPAPLPPLPQGHLSEGYGKLCSVYLKLLITKMEFHVKVRPRDLGRTTL